MRYDFWVLVLFEIFFFFAYSVNIWNIVYYKKNEKEIKRRYWGKNKIDVTEYYSNLFLIFVANALFISFMFGWM